HPSVHSFKTKMVFRTTGASARIAEEFHHAGRSRRVLRHLCRGMRQVRFFRVYFATIVGLSHEDTAKTGEGIELKECGRRAVDRYRTTDIRGHSGTVSDPGADDEIGVSVPVQVFHTD